MIARFTMFAGLCLALVACQDAPEAGVPAASLSSGGATGVSDVRPSGGALGLTNTERGARGLGTLSRDDRLLRAARKHVAWMAKNGRMSHRGTGGSTMSDRIKAEGYRACFAAENVAFGQKTATDVTEAWMASKGHRTNILDRRAQHGAVAHAVDGAGQTYWVMVLARPC
ncbi:CAP domain-containing protein [Jannaschia sp. M317]|uniref:CAP domain-containing protein n=1 Tax=Jannaschia sp. M317 TaxID=2867011 RepID=UPI0021A91CFB|nr:CAP domain-containing protein [Jannaschia sp. M317]UWQ18646.1 CAP domain-containing protein [Jannaschia sp. M317]